MDGSGSVRSAPVVILKRPDDAEELGGEVEMDDEFPGVAEDPCDTSVMVETSQSRNASGQSATGLRNSPKSKSASNSWL